MKTPLQYSEMLTHFETALTRLLQPLENRILKLENPEQKSLEQENRLIKLEAETQSIKSSQESLRLDFQTMQQGIHSQLKGLSALEELLTQCSAWPEELKTLKKSHQDHSDSLLLLKGETTSLKASGKSMSQELQTLQQSIDSHLKDLPDLEKLLDQCSNWSAQFNAIGEKCESLENRLKTLRP